MTNVYEIGTLVRVSWEYRNLDGDLADPTAVEFKWLKPGGTVQTWQVEADEVVNDAVGKYHADLTIDVKGTWLYKAFGTGAVHVAQEGWFYVKTSAL
jgi:hypothetical protein